MRIDFGVSISSTPPAWLIQSHPSIQTSHFGLNCLSFSISSSIVTRTESFPFSASGQRHEQESFQFPTILQACLPDESLSAHPQLACKTMQTNHPRCVCATATRHPSDLVEHELRQALAPKLQQLQATTALL